MSAISVESNALDGLRVTLRSSGHSIADALDRARITTDQAVDEMRRRAVQARRESEYWTSEYENADEEDDISYLEAKMDEARERAAELECHFSNCQVVQEQFSRRCQALKELIENRVSGGVIGLGELIDAVHEVSAHQMGMDLRDRTVQKESIPPTARTTQTSDIGRLLRHSSNTLNPSAWASMQGDSAARLGVLREAALLIAEGLGIDCPTIKSYSEDGPAAGGYNLSDRSISFNLDGAINGSRFFDDFRETLDTLAHEMRHAYQHAAVLGEVEHDQSATWRREFERSAPVDFERYWHQSVEVDARSFAEQVVSSFEET